MPPCEIILEHADETVLRIFTQVGATDESRRTSAIFLKVWRNETQHGGTPVPRSGAGDNSIYVSRERACAEIGLRDDAEKRDAPKYEVGVGHEIRYAFEHAPWLEDECWKGDL
jgi:hypothetical protein